LLIEPAGKQVHAYNRQTRRDADQRAAQAHGER
jgi:hypothetical protein